MLRLVFLLLTSVFLNACFYDNEEDLYVEELSYCDTTNVTYNTTIVPMFKVHCNSCHGTVEAPSLGGGINLESYYGVNSTADDGSLLGSMEYNSKYASMPIDYKLYECSIKKVRVWINTGAENNK